MNAELNTNSKAIIIGIIFTILFIPSSTPFMNKLNTSFF